MGIITKHKSYLLPLYLSIHSQCHWPSPNWLIYTKKKIIQRLRKASTAFVIRIREDEQIPFHVVKDI